MNEELTNEQLYFLEEGGYVPTLIDERILVYLNLGFHVMLKSTWEYEMPFCFYLSEGTNNTNLRSHPTYSSSELKELKDKYPELWIIPFAVTKEQVIEWIEWNS